MFRIENKKKKLMRKQMMVGMRMAPAAEARLRKHQPEEAYWAMLAPPVIPQMIRGTPQPTR